MNTPGKLSTELSTMQSYDTLLLDTQKTANIYTLVRDRNNSQLFTYFVIDLGLTESLLALQTMANPVGSKVNNAGTAWPVLPPFRPPPTFESDRPKMPPSNNRGGRSVASLASATMVSYFIIIIILYLYRA